MSGIELVRLDPALENAVASHPEYLDALAREDWAGVAELVHRVIGRTLLEAPLRVDALEWGGYFVVDRETREVVGSCAFKAPPTDDGVVEIAYFTYPGFEGRGYATAMARKLIELASGSPAVRRIIAHTLPETNASTRVLERVGMTFAGEVTDPEDGVVWCWELSPRQGNAGADAPGSRTPAAG